MKQESDKEKESESTADKGTDFPEPDNDADDDDDGDDADGDATEPAPPEKTSQPATDDKADKGEGSPYCRYTIFLKIELEYFGAKRVRG